MSGAASSGDVGPPTGECQPSERQPSEGQPSLRSLRGLGGLNVLMADVRDGETAHHADRTGPVAA